MKTTILTILAICLVSFATSMYAGETIIYETEIENLSWDITCNSSNLEGLNISHIGNEIILSTQMTYIPDNFTITFYDENYEEIIIINPPSSGSSGRSGRLICSDGYEKINNRCVLINTQDLENKSNEISKIEEPSSSNDSVIDSSPDLPVEKEKYSLFWIIIPCIMVIVGFIVWIVKVQFLNDEIEDFNKFNMAEDEKEVNKYE